MTAKILKNSSIIFISMLMSPIGVLAQKILVIEKGTLHTATGVIFDPCLMICSANKITYVGKYGDNISTIDTSNSLHIIIPNKHVYPGIIALNSTLGLVEVDAIRASDDTYEVGTHNTNVVAASAFNVDSDIIPTIRNAGIIYTEATPRGDVIAGKSSLMYTYGTTVDSATLIRDAALHIYWPSKYAQHDGFMRTSPIKLNEKRDEQLLQLQELFKQASQYVHNSKFPNLKLAALHACIHANKPLMIHVDDASEILASLSFFESIPNKVIVGGRDAWMIADDLAKKNIPVVLSRIHDLPTRTDEDVNLLYKTPFLLEKAGVKTTLSYSGDMEAMGQRNLPFTAGTAASFGMDKEAALATITLHPATLLGVQHRIGSLETNKDATFIVTEGDIFNPSTSNVEMIFINGLSIPLNDKQKALYIKYSKKE